MSVGPRIVFIRFLSGDSPKLVPWVTHAERVAGESQLEAAEATEGGRVVWQLVSANNRELARGCYVHNTFEEARADAASVVGLTDGLEVALVSEAARGEYGWFATVDGRPVVTCARWYSTARDRQHSIELAIRSIPAATLHAGTRLTDRALMAGDRASLV